MMRRVGLRALSVVLLMVFAHGHRVEAGQRAGAYTVTHDRSARATHRGARVVVRDVSAPAAVVSRQLSEQPVHAHLVEVRVGGSTIFIDLDKDYIRQGNYKIDENHFIPAAQRLARSLLALPARTIRGGTATRVFMVPAPGRPHMIFMRPPLLPQPKNDRPDPEPRESDAPKFADAH